MNLLTKSCKSIFYVLTVHCYCTYIFKSSYYRSPDLLSRTYFKNSYFDTGISNYLEAEFLEFWLGMVNAGWLGSMQSQIFLQMKFIIFQNCPIKQTAFLHE